jgi:hypothetical protein
MWNWLRKLLVGIKAGIDAYGLFTSEFFRAVILPTLIMAGGVVLTAIYEWPWPEIYLAAVFLFAASAHGLLRFDEWRQRNRVEHKLLFNGVHVASDRSPDGSALTTVQIAAVLRNNASFPISYKVTRIRTTADDTLPSLGAILNYGAIIQPECNDLFRDRAINLKLPKAAMNATLEVELLYGRPQREKYPLSRSINLSLRYDPKTGVLSYPWLDAPRAVPST